jgi:hypothetical protein
MTHACASRRRRRRSCLGMHAEAAQRRNPYLSRCIRLRVRASAPRRFRGNSPASQHLPTTAVDVMLGLESRTDRALALSWRHQLHRSIPLGNDARLSRSCSAVPGLLRYRMQIGRRNRQPFQASIGGRSTRSMRWYAVPHRMFAKTTTG